MNVENDFKKNSEKIFTLAKKAAPYVYKVVNGEEVTENIGNYCAFITRDMVRELETVSLLLASPYPEYSKKVRKVSAVMKNKDLTICRMIDDKKADRELSEYSFNDTEGAVIILKQIYESHVFSEKPFSFYKPKVKAWCERFIKLDVMAYYLKSQDFLRTSLKLASLRAFDADGNIVFGISQKDENCAKTMIEIEKLFLNALIRLPVYSDELSECMKKIECIELVIEALVQGKTELIRYLSKCAEAAKDFEDFKN